MKRHIFFGGLFMTFLAEIVFLILFAFPKSEKSLDIVAVNEAVQTVQNNWPSFKAGRNLTSLDYVVIGSGGEVLYRTKPGLSESMNAAIRHKDTILDVEVKGLVVGKMIVYNSDARILQAEKRTVLFAMTAIMLLQCCICAGYFFYMQRTVIKPFQKLKKFAERIAGGNLDIPLEMDRQNLFGAFTESFDIMRSELKVVTLQRPEILP